MLVCLILVINIYVFSAAANKIVPSVEFKSEKSEIDFGASDSEPKSGDFESDISDTLYYDDGYLEVTEAPAADNSTFLPNEVFLAMRNSSSETEFRNFNDRNDILDLDASASENVKHNISRSSSELNTRTLRDASLEENSGEEGIPLFVPHKHTKIDTAHMSDCALQGEWKPMGVSHSHHNYQDEPELLVGNHPNDWNEPDNPESHQLRVVSANLGVKSKHADDSLALSPPPMPHVLLIKKPSQWINNKAKLKPPMLPPPSYLKVPPPAPMAVSLPVPLPIAIPTLPPLDDNHLVGTHPLHQFVSNDGSTFTCGKNHDHGTKFHTASFQVVGDDDASEGLYHAEESMQKPQYNPWNDKFTSTIAPSVYSRIVAAKRASNHRYPKPQKDYIGETNTHNHFNEISQVAKYPSNGPVQFEQEPQATDSDQSEFVRELEQLTNRFQFDLKSPPPADFFVDQELKKNEFFNEEDQNEDYHHPNEDYQHQNEDYHHQNVEHSTQEQPPVFHHSGHNVVNVNEYEAPHENYNAHDAHDESDVTKINFPPQTVPSNFEYQVPHPPSPPAQEYPPYFNRVQPQYHGENRPYTSDGIRFSLPVSVAEHHPHKGNKPKAHKPPKRKHPTKQYEVHENSGERQTPLSEIFPPKKSPKQFNMRMPNFAVGRPKKPQKPSKPPKPLKPSKPYTDGIEISTIHHIPLRGKKITTLRPKPKRKHKPQLRSRRRPVTDPSIKLSTPIIRVVEVSTS